MIKLGVCTRILKMQNMSMAQNSKALVNEACYLV